MKKEYEVPFAIVRAKQDREMAEYLRFIGHRRTDGRCPVCNNIVTLENFRLHIVDHE